MANKIIHKRSSALLENGKPKLPTADNLEYGELAINFAKGAETISFKNKADEIVTISSTERLEQIIIDNEEVTAAALTDLDERMLAVENKGSLTIDDVYAEGFLTYVPSEYVTESELADKGYLTSIPANYVTESELEAALSTVEVDLSDYMTIDELDETYASKDDLSTINTTIEENELVISNALNDLNGRLVLLENVNSSTVITNLNNQITTMQQTITELQAEIETMKTELNKTLTVE
jgi:vacuolar-type H+-ATPase subunit I/STV1